MKLYLGIIGVVVLLLTVVWLGYKHVDGQREHEKIRADIAESQLLARTDEVNQERKNAKDAESRALSRFNEKEVLQREYDEKVKCIDAGNCGVVVRYKSAICSPASVHSSEPGASGSDELQISEQKNFGRWLSSLQQSISNDEKVIEGLKDELELKSSPEYCRVK